MKIVWHIVITLVELLWISMLLVSAILLLVPPISGKGIVIGIALIMVAMEMVVNRTRRLTRES